MTGPLLSSDPSSIGGHRLLGRLGVGGMGVVYLGRAESGGLVAVKVIRADFAGDPDFRARFRREVQAARRVSSPWAVAVTGADTEVDEAVARHRVRPGPFARRSGRAGAARCPSAVCASWAGCWLRRCAKCMSAGGFSKPLLAPQAVLDPAFTRQAGPTAEGWLLSASFTDPTVLPAAKAFTAAFRERYRSAPGYYAAEAYDATNLVIGELVKAAKKGRPSRRELVALLRGSTYQGLTKRYSFKPEDGTFTGQGVFFHRVEDGAFRFVGPALTT